MSSNTQIHLKAVSVSGVSAISIAELLGNGGAKKIDDLLKRLQHSVDFLSEPHRAEFNWKPTVDGKWSTTVDNDIIVLNLANNLAEMTCNGTRYVNADSQTPTDFQAMMAHAGKRVNNLLSLAVALELSERLSGYVNQKVRQNVAQKIQVRTVNTVKNRVAIRAKAAVRIRIR